MNGPSSPASRFASEALERMPGLYAVEKDVRRSSEWFLQLPGGASASTAARKGRDVRYRRESWPYAHR